MVLLKPEHLLRLPAALLCSSGSVVVDVEALDLPLPAFVVRGQRCRWPRGRARTTAGAPSAQRGHLVLRWGHRPALNFLGGNLCPTSGGHLPSSRSQC